jgi:hypothetical protein
VGDARLILEIFMRRKIGGVLLAFFSAVTFSAAKISWADDDTSDALWQYYPPVSAPAKPGRAKSDSASRQNGTRAEQTPYWATAVSSQPAESDRSLYGQSGNDNLFATESRPSWTPPSYEKPTIDRPSFSYPSTDVPLYRMEPARAPVAQQPLYVKPNDDKPSNYIDNYEGPGYIAPTPNAPVVVGPNYVKDPYLAPADKAPTYDQGQIEYDRPEYTGPVYQPDEYRPTRELPPEYDAPPRE